MPQSKNLNKAKMKFSMCWVRCKKEMWEWESERGSCKKCVVRPVLAYSNNFKSLKSSQSINQSMNRQRIKSNVKCTHIHRTVYSTIYFLEMWTVFDTWNVNTFRCVSCIYGDMCCQCVGYKTDSLQVSEFGWIHHTPPQSSHTHTHTKKTGNGTGTGTGTRKANKWFPFEIREN